MRAHLITSCAVLAGCSAPTANPPPKTSAPTPAEVRSASPTASGYVGSGEMPAMPREWPLRFHPLKGPDASDEALPPIYATLNARFDRECTPEIALRKAPLDTSVTWWYGVADIVRDDAERLHLFECLPTNTGRYRWDDNVVECAQNGATFHVIQTTHDDPGHAVTLIREAAINKINPELVLLLHVGGESRTSIQIRRRVLLEKEQGVWWLRPITATSSLGMSIKERDWVEALMVFGEPVGAARDVGLEPNEGQKLFAQMISGERPGLAAYYEHLCVYNRDSPEFDDNQFHRFDRERLHKLWRALH